MKKERQFEQYLAELEQEMENLYENFHSTGDANNQVPSIDRLNGDALRASNFLGGFA